MRIKFFFIFNFALISPKFFSNVYYKMDREKAFKKEIRSYFNKENKMSDNYKMASFRKIQNFAGATLESCPPIEMNYEQIKADIFNKDKKNYFYEWVTHDTPVKPYYDIDAFFMPSDKYIKHKKVEGYYETEEEKKQLCKDILDKATNEIKNIFQKGELAISSSCGEKTNTWSVKGKKTKFVGYAVSYHIVVAGYECKVGDLEAFNEKVGLDKKLTGYDKSVYSDGQNFRAIFSSKPNDKRVKTPVNYEATNGIHLIHSTEFSNIGFCKLPEIKNSPPSSPPRSPKKSVEEEAVEEEEEVEEFKPIIEKKKYNPSEIQKILDCLPDHLYEYDEWIKIGMAVHNATNGDDIGIGLFNQWSKKDKDNYDLDNIKSTWKYLTKTAHNGKKKLGMTYLRKLYEQYKPIDYECPLEFIFSKIVNEKYQKMLDICDTEKQREQISPSQFYHIGEDAILNEMNNRMIFVKETGDYIILDTQEIHENGEIIRKKCWYLKSPTKAKDHYLKEKFTYYPKPNKKIKKKEDMPTPHSVDPFRIWCEWIGRKEVRAIGFDPSDQPKKDIFNLWKGYNISQELAENYKVEDAQPILDIVKDIWCNGNEDSYEYVLNYFAHILQKPHIKMGVLLALKSKQGGCKGIVLKKLEEIIGDDHYCQNSNADHLFGNFNGQLEGKVLVNLDEAFWGGDKKLEGVMKNKITEQKQTINKKNKENYIIDCYANYIITTNNDWFAGTTEDDRRYYCLELNNKFSGRMTKEKEGIIQKVLDAPAGAFAKFLFNRDISGFNARIFKKTKLAQEQVERNWNSVKVWWNMVMKEGGFIIDDDFVEMGEVLEKHNDNGVLTKIGGMYIRNKKKEKATAYCKDWLFNVYNSHSSDARKFSKSAFYRDLIKNCLTDEHYNEIRIQKKNCRKPFIILPSIDKCREIWNEQQEYDYEYETNDNEWEEYDCMISDDE